MAQASEQPAVPANNAAQNGQQQQEEESPYKVLMSTLSNFAMLYFAFTVVKNTLNINKEQQNQDVQENPLHQDSTDATESTAPKYVNVPERTEYTDKIIPYWTASESLQLRVYLSELENLPNPLPSDSLVFKSKPVNLAEEFKLTNTKLSYKTTDNLKNNGTLFAHTYLVKLEGEVRDTMEHEFNYVEGDDMVYYKQVLNHFVPLKKEKKLKKLLDKAEEVEKVEEEKVEQVDDTKNEGGSGLDAVKNLFKNNAPIVSHWYPNITIQLVQDNNAIPLSGMHPAVKDHIKLLPVNKVHPNYNLNQFYPVVYFNKFWILQKDLTPINSTVEELPINIEFSSTKMWKFQIQVMSTAQFTEQLKMMGGDASELDIVKETLLENSPWMLGATFIVSILHSLFDFLAFKNDISFWKQKKDNIGVSVRTLIMNVIFQLITFLYLFDNSEATSWMIILSSGAGLLIEVWKIKKAMNIEIIPSQGTLLPYKLKFNTKEVSELEEKTDEYDQQAYTYLSYVAYPLLICYAIYSMLYNEHKGWYSFFINTAVGFVYAFGFITMTPQLFINYKLKSVSHMPWRTFMYKALNTFVDDMFAFIIKMPFLHRLACLRDDVVFFIYLYQRWIYPEDSTRANEYGQVGEQKDEKKDSKLVKDKEAEKKDDKVDEETKKKQ